MVFLSIYIYIKYIMSQIQNFAFSRLLRISNIHSVNAGDSITNFTVNLNRMTETNNIIRCVTKSVSFTNSAYNIRTNGTNKNNVFNFEIQGDTTYEVSIPVAGFYNVSQIIDVIKPSIELILSTHTPGSTVSIVSDPITKKIVISWTGGTLLRFPGTSELNTTLGNTIDSGFVFNTYSFNLFPDLYGLTQVYVHSTLLAEGNLVDGDVENHDIVSEIPINVPFGQYVHYESNESELDSVNYASPRDFDSVKITLEDLDGNIIDLNSGVFTIIFKIYYL